MLKFLGVGSCLNPELGNTSAFIRRGTSFILIDCGSSVFSRIIEQNLLSGIREIHILITHTHTDHVGSLPDLIFYCWYILKLRPTVIYPESMKIQEFFHLTGVSSEIFETKKIPLSSTYHLHSNLGTLQVTAFQTEHSHNIGLCCGYLVFYQKQSIYYSGDSKSIPSSVLEAFRENRIQLLYQDVTGYSGAETPHLFIGNLADLIPLDQRKKVYCMHIDTFINDHIIKQYGFSNAKELLI